jgi:hypothetical protein
MEAAGCHAIEWGIAAQNHAPAPAKAPMAQTPQDVNGLACGLQITNGDPKQFGRRI